MNDIHKLHRFVEAQERVYESAVRELRCGKKCGHWMWYVFPQIAGLGMSATTRRYAIKSIDEARAYYAHSILGSRLRECTQLVIDVSGSTVSEIFGYPDDLKFRSCMTLFDYATDDDALFRDALVKYYGGQADQTTIDILESGVDRL
jgi:uncharacterized protein (DUF1810 family)